MIRPLLLGFSALTLFLLAWALFMASAKVPRGPTAALIFRLLAFFAGGCTAAGLLLMIFALTLL